MAADIKSKLSGARAKGIASQQAVAQAAANQAIIAKNNLERVTRGGKEYKNILRQYKDAMTDTPMPHVAKYDGLGYKWSNQDRHAWLCNQIYGETLPFFDNNAKTSILRTMIRRVSSKVLDNYTVTDADGNEVKDITIDMDGLVAEYNIDANNYSTAVRQLMLGGKVYLVAYIDEYGGLYFKVKDRYNVRPNPTGYDILYTDRGIAKVERRHLEDGTARPIIELIQQDKQGNWTIKVEAPNGQQFDALDTFGVYELSIDQFVTEGTLELVLMYSQLFGTIDKELVMGALQLFADKGYSSRGLMALQDFFTPVDTPKTSLSMAEGGRPLWEVYAPTLRDASMQTLRDIVREEIAVSLMLDRSSLGLDSNGATATEETIKLSASVDTINLLKAEVAESLNTFIGIFLGVGYKITIERYQVNDMATRVDVASKAKQAGIMSIEASVEYIHPDWSDEDKDKEVIRLKMAGMEELTPAEEAKAIEYGLILPQEGAPQQVAEPIEGDAEVLDIDMEE